MKRARSQVGGGIYWRRRDNVVAVAVSNIAVNARDAKPAPTSPAIASVKTSFSRSSASNRSTRTCVCISNAAWCRSRSWSTATMAAPCCCGCRSWPMADVDSVSTVAGVAAAAAASAAAGVRNGRSCSMFGQAHSTAAAELLPPPPPPPLACAALSGPAASPSEVVVAGGATIVGAAGWPLSALLPSPLPSCKSLSPPPPFVVIGAGRNRAARFSSKRCPLACASGLAGTFRQLSRQRPLAGAGGGRQL